MKHSLLSTEEKVQLIQDYQPGAFFLASPKRRYLQRGYSSILKPINSMNSPQR